jgi:hypothetical protein
MGRFDNVRDDRAHRRRSACAPSCAPAPVKHAVLSASASAFDIESFNAYG